MGDVVPAHTFADPTSRIPSHRVSIAATSTLRGNSVFPLPGYCTVQKKPLSTIPSQQAGARR